MISALAWAAAHAGAARKAAATTCDPAPLPSIHIEDVSRFYRVYDAAHGHPTAAQLQHDYLDPGSDGLHTFARVRNISGTRIEEALNQHPDIYSTARRCMAVLPRVRRRLQVALHTLGRLYPEARFPPVTIAVGRGKPVGVGSPASGVQIGLEALCATDWLNPNIEDRFVHVIAHEYAHIQQVPALVDDDHPPVLEGSLVEGAAEFTAELISGEVAYSGFRTSTKGQRNRDRVPRRSGQDGRFQLAQQRHPGKARRPGLLGRLSDPQELLHPCRRQAPSVARKFWR